MRKGLNRYFALLAGPMVMVLMLAAGANAQMTGGTISGTVVDPQNGVIPNATVVAVQVQQNLAQTTSTNDQGQSSLNA